jgi:hypothetical protein
MYIYLYIMAKIIAYKFLPGVIRQQVIHQNILRSYVVMGAQYIQFMEYIAQGEQCQIFFKT